MLHVAFFWALLISTASLALRFGGGPERWTAGMFVAAAVATRLAHEPVAQRFYEVELSVLAIDLALLFGLVAITVASDRFWPPCMVALHLLTVSAHVAKALDYQLVRKAYSIALAAPSYGTLALLLIATLRHQRRLRTLGADGSWNTSLLRDPHPTRREPPTA